MCGEDILFHRATFLKTIAILSIGPQKLYWNCIQLFNVKNFTAQDKQAALCYGPGRLNFLRSYHNFTDPD